MDVWDRAPGRGREKERIGGRDAGRGGRVYKGLSWWFKRGNEADWEKDRGGTLRKAK